MVRFFAVVLAVASLSACAVNVTMMPRDAGKPYYGDINFSGGDSGTMSVLTDDGICKGPIATVGSNQTFGLLSSFASDNRGGSASGASIYSQSGDSYLKALLSCTNGEGLRCDLRGRNRSGGGICVDNKGRVYDVIGTPKG